MSLADPVLPKLTRKTSRIVSPALESMASFEARPLRCRLGNAVKLAGLMWRIAHAERACRDGADGLAVYDIGCPNASRPT